MKRRAVIKAQISLPAINTQAHIRVARAKTLIKHEYTHLSLVQGERRKVDRNELISVDKQDTLILTLVGRVTHVG